MKRQDLFSGLILSAAPLLLSSMRHSIIVGFAVRLAVIGLCDSFMTDGSVHNYTIVTTPPIIILVGFSVGQSWTYCFRLCGWMSWHLNFDWSFVYFVQAACFVLKTVAHTCTCIYII